MINLVPLTLHDRKRLDDLISGVRQNPTREGLARLCGALLDFENEGRDLGEYTNKTSKIIDEYRPQLYGDATNEF